MIVAVMLVVPVPHVIAVVIAIVVAVAIVVIAIVLAVSMPLRQRSSRERSQHQHPRAPIELSKHATPSSATCKSITGKQVTEGHGPRLWAANHCRATDDSRRHF